MRALTVRQPWAGFIAAGHKPYEFRSWRPRLAIGARLAIHAAARRPPSLEIATLILELEAGRLAVRPAAIETLRGWRNARYTGRPDDSALGAFVAICRYGGIAPIEEVEREFGAPALRREVDRGYIHAWRLTAVEACAPYPVRGRQGVWKVPLRDRLLATPA